jgi:hypothetical protein
LDNYLLSIIRYLFCLMKTYALASILLFALSFSLGNISMFKAMAETGVGKDVFKVVVSLYGITNSTKDIITLINVDDHTKVELYNAENPGKEGSGKVSYVVTFPNLSVHDGEPYHVCTMSVEDFKLKCEEGKNSPFNRPEFVDINTSVSSKESGKS